jgi:hypothetical protein
MHLLYQVLIVVDPCTHLYIKISARMRQILLFLWLHHMATHENWHAIQRGIISSKGRDLRFGDGSLCLQYGHPDRPEIVRLCKQCSAHLMTLYDTSS